MRRPTVLAPHARRLLAGVALSTGLALSAAPAPALAAPSPGTVEVAACATSTARRTDAWRPTLSTAEPVEAADLCRPTALPKVVGTLDPAGTFGFWATTPAPDPPLAAKPGRIVGYTATAPTGTAFTGATLDRIFALRSADWEIQVRADDAVVLRCTGPTSNGGCANGTAAAGTMVDVPTGATRIDVAAYCVASTTCAYLDGTTPTFSALLRGASLTLSDGTAPAASEPVAGGRVDEQITSESTITAAASDALGVERVQLIEDGDPIATYYATCVDWSLTPCAEASAGGAQELRRAFKVGELGLSTGAHVLRVRAVDKAGNATLGDPTTVIVREPLFAATALLGGGRSSAATRELRWSVPAAMNAVSAAVELCPADGPCTQTPVATPAGPFGFSSADHPDVRARVRLTSVGGGVTWSEPLSFVYDATPPAAPRLAVSAATTGRRFTIRLTTGADEADLAAWTARLCQTATAVCTPLSKGVLTRSGSVDIPVTAPADSGYRLDATLTDTAGNESAAGQVGLTVGASSPAAAGTPTARPARAGLTVSPVLPKKLKGSSLLVRGTTSAGSAGALKRVVVTVTGRTKAKKAVRASKTARLSKAGAFAVRIALPRGLDRRRGALVTIVATPATGSPTTTRTRLRG